MTILAIDTSMQACSAALYDNRQQQIIAARYQSMERGHAEVLTPMMRDILEEAAVAPHQISEIVVTTGPGTFTGVRVGLAAARGFGLALGLQVKGVDSLWAISCNESNAHVPCIVAVDARRDEIYLGIFGANREILLAPCVSTRDEAVQRCPSGSAIVMGSAANTLIDASGRGDLRRSTAKDFPDAAAFVRRAANLPPAQTIPQPLYLRGVDAKPQVKAAQPLITMTQASVLDASLLAALHAESFEVPWQQDDMARLMTMPGVTAMIASSGDEPLGFGLFRQAVDEVEILTIATRPSGRRRGVARGLIAEQARRYAEAGIVAMFIEVAQSNETARALYQHNGFAEVGRRKGYYPNSNGSAEDAILMRKTLQK